MNNNNTGKKIIFAILMIALVFFPLIVGDDSFLVYISTLFLFYFVLGAGLNLIMVTGQLSLGHAAFMGVGAYACALLTVKLQWAFWPSWIIGGALAGIIAWVLGRITLRIKGTYFAILTFSFGEIVRLIFANVPFFGGMNGILNIPAPSFSIPGLFHISFEGKIAFYYLVLVFSLLCFIIYFRIKYSPLGQVLKSISEADFLSKSCGIDIMKYKLFVFVIASIWAGMVGGLMGSFITFISPDSFTVVESINLILINVIGGVATISGPVFGALFLIGIPELIRGAKEYQMIVFGVAIVLALFFLPNGVGGLFELGKKVKVKKKPEH